MFSILYVLFAQYGCGSYGDGGYNSCTSPADTPLSDTGEGALMGIILGGVLVAVALLLLGLKILKKKKNKKK